jgi:hypothetical protein
VGESGEGIVNPPEQIEVTEGELNSFVNLSLGPQLPHGVSRIEFSFKKGHVGARALVDIAEVQQKLGVDVPAGGWSLLGGPVPVELDGQIISDDGFASINVKQVRVASIPVPVSVLEHVVASSTRTARNPKGVDILSPFRLPYSVRRIRVRAGRALLEF